MLLLGKIMFKRAIKNQIIADFFKGKIIIIAGPRQVGKTTLCEEIISELGATRKIKKFNGDDPESNPKLSDKSLDFLKNLVSDADIVFIDEGQKIAGIGNTLKMLVDYYKELKQFVVTGSSSFNLLDCAEEYLTGRKFTYFLYPLALAEIKDEKIVLPISKYRRDLLIYGLYPKVVTLDSYADKERELRELISSYLYKDVFEFNDIKKSSLIVNLIKALALQIGSEASYSELAGMLGINYKTVESYIDLLEKNFIVFRLNPYFKNKRNEISKSKRKIYFYDTGVRNAAINNFQDFSDRNDIGQLWENFVIAERLKFQKYNSLSSLNYFWRTYDGAEIDWVEERSGKIFGYEIKWNPGSIKKAPPSWGKYENSEFKIITPDNLEGFGF